MTKLNYSDTYILNPLYKFRSDIKRIILTNNDSLMCNVNDPEVANIADVSFHRFVHPFIAKFFSYFNGSMNLKDTLKHISNKTKLPFDEIEKSAIPLIENTESMVFPITEEKVAFSLPKNFLIKKTKNDTIRDILNNIDIEKIYNDSDYKNMRLYIPNEAVLHITNNCYTDCTYCYADRKYKISKYLSYSRIIELIKEANQLQMRDFEISGGDFFLYKKWKEILKTLNNYGYMPTISTKVPISKEIIYYLKEAGINLIQISIDTVINEEIKKILNVDNSYLKNLMDTFNNLEKCGLRFRVKSVITKINDNIKSVKKLIDYLLSFNSCVEVNIAPGEYSLYREFDYRTTVDKIEKIHKYVNERKLKDNRVRMLSYDQSNHNKSKEEIKKSWKERSICSGNLSSFYILPDGKVTLCEQLYWHSKLIIGDLSKQSIWEFWNSKEALNLWNIKQNDIKEESPCHYCKSFDECRRGLGNCYLKAIMAYGEDKWDYPAPDCPLAPPEKNNIYLK